MAGLLPIIPTVGGVVSGLGSSELTSSTATPIPKAKRAISTNESSAKSLVSLVSFNFFLSGL